MSEIAYKARFNADGSMSKTVAGVNRGMQQFRNELRGASRDAAASRRGINGLNASLGKTNQLMRRAALAVGAYLGLREIANALKYGAALGDAREQAEGLLRAQRTTVDAVMPRLRAATRGMVADRELLQLSAQGLTGGVGVKDLELLGRAASAYSNRTGQSIGEAFKTLQEGLVKGSRGALAAVGLNADALEGLDIRSKVNVFRRELGRLADAFPADSVVDKYERLTTTLTNIRDRFAEAFVENPQFLEFLDKVNAYFSSERVTAWADSISRALNTLTLRGFLQRLELELSKFLRTPAGRIVAGLTGAGLGARLGGTAGAMIGGSRLAFGGWGALAGAGIALATGQTYDPLGKVFESVRDEYLKTRGASPSVESLAKKFSPEYLLALRDEASQRKAPLDLYSRLFYAWYPASGLDSRGHPLPRNMPDVTPHGGTASAELGARRVFTGGDSWWKAGAGLPLSLKYPGSGTSYLERARMAAGLPASFGSDYAPGKLFGLRGELDRGKPKAETDLADAMQLATGAVEILAGAVASLNFKAEALGSSFGNLFASIGTTKLAGAIGSLGGKKIPGAPSFAAQLGLGLGMLGVGTLLGALFGKKTEQRQEKYLEAIARNTDRSAELLSKILGAPTGFIRGVVGVPSYAGLGVAAFADSRR